MSTGKPPAERKGHVLDGHGDREKGGGQPRGPCKSEGEQHTWTFKVPPFGSTQSCCDGPICRKRRADSDSMEAGPSSKRSCVSQSRQMLLLELPSELLNHILQYLTCGEISKVRLVCKQFDEISQQLLNRAFLQVQTNMQQRFQQIKSQMPRRESARRRHPLARECDIIETLHMRLTLLQMTFGKHIERKHCCFFPGEILDEINRILMYVKSTKSTSNLGRAYKVTDELFDLSTMAMEYFKEHIEPHLPEINYFTTEFTDYTTNVTGTRHTSLIISQALPSKDAQTAESDSPHVCPGQKQKPSSEVKLNSFRRSMQNCSRDVSTLKKQLRIYRKKTAHQHKQLIECNSKLEQHERRFEEQDKKFDALLRELRQCKSQLNWYRQTFGDATEPAQVTSTDTSMTI